MGINPESIVNLNSSPLRLFVGAKWMRGFEVLINRGDLWGVDLKERLHAHLITESRVTIWPGRDGKDT